MSSPTKQVSARRLPPLANSNPGKLLVRRSPKTATDVEEREALRSNVGASSSNTIRSSTQDVNKGILITVGTQIAEKSFVSIIICFAAC